MIRQLVLICIFILMASSAQAQEHEVYSASELPGIIISYNVYCERYNTFKSLSSIPPFKKLQNGLGDGISTAMAFTREKLIVQNIKGRFSGYTYRKEDFSILFVTTPINKYNDRVICLLSQVSPDRLTIFSVDKNFNTEILYDTRMDTRQFDLGSIYGIKVIRPGRFLIYENYRSGGRQFSSEVPGRSFIISFEDGNFNINLFSEKEKK